ncbi:MmgE/PrpD family protein [Azospirillum endophyticum]
MSEQGILSVAGTAEAGTTRSLARFAAETRSVPAEVFHAARRALANIVANMVAGSQDPEIATMLRANRWAVEFGQSTVLGLADKADPLTASLLNAASGNILDFDDTHPNTLIHPSAPVLAALLPVAERNGSTLEEILLALAIGTEVAVRVGEAVSPDHYASGWHITATCGTIGAAAGVARLMGLTGASTVHAIGIACTQTGGLVENLSFMAKSVGVGNAGRNGLQAALYASAGIDASETALEGPNGFFRVSCSNPKPELAVDGLGSRWLGASTAPKPYPTCVLLHPVIDAVLELRPRIRASGAGIARILVRGHPLLLARADRELPTTGREAKLSIHHAVAATITRGTAGIGDYDDAAARDESLRRLALRVRADADEAIEAEAAVVRVEFEDGSTAEQHVAAARGSEKRPLTDDELLAKCTNLVQSRFSDGVAEEFVRLSWQGKTAEDLRRLLALGSDRNQL